jgi:hypothetical protein
MLRTPHCIDSRLTDGGKVVSHLHRPGTTPQKHYLYGSAKYYHYCYCYGSGLERREYGLRDPPRLPRGTLYPQTLALTSPTSGGRSVGIVRSRTHATEFGFCIL